MKTGEMRVNQLRRRIGHVLIFRSILRWSTLLFLAYGTLILAGRLLFRWPHGLLLMGLCIVLPILGWVAIRAWSLRPSSEVVRAALDCYNDAGGFLMASAQVGLAEWEASMPALSLPSLVWRKRQSMVLFAVAACYVVLVQLIPESKTAWIKRRTLEIGPLVQRLDSQIDALAEERIIEPSKLSELKEQLSRLSQESSGLDPARTWEALDHLEQTTSEAARNSAAETEARLEALSQAETLAAALALSSATNLNDQVTTEAMRELGHLMQSASLDRLLSSNDLTPQLLAALQTNALDTAQLGQIMQAIASCRGQLGQSLANLAQMKLIDPSLLAKCAGMGRAGDSNGLAAFLAECSSTSGSLSADWKQFGRGGVNRGRGDAPMTWSEGTSEKNALFKEQVLPRNAFNPNESQLVGVSRTDPQLTENGVPLSSGALNPNLASGGSAPTHKILPRHKHTVENFFQRKP